mmetsp:Transcript_89612/g.253996  ORF Transcript_89612/g.253996 Transcript_89612/m.253996 type:complete len:1065 (+) Transcript_89612:195-3389(+)
MDAGGDKPKKNHKKAHAGRKADKKKEKRVGKVDRHNPRAFTFSGGSRGVQKRVQYTLEKQAKKDHAPKVDKNPELPPPFIVVVHGPPGVGKTTLIHSLVKHYAKQKLLRLHGPITLVSGRQRRLTIVECPQDMSAMLDLAKVADLVLLLIDASFGFELETFEFINILQVHGFPRVIGVLTHLDGFRENKQLRKVKKTMKHRFWTEIYEGAKLFYLSGLQYGRYHRVEVQNLVRFIAVQKCPILSWRQNHPYMLALRWEDKTQPSEAEGAPRTLDLYGYVCGGRLREGGQAHLAGVGDFQIDAVKVLNDPCPLPVTVETERQKTKEALLGDGRATKPKRKNGLRTLAERHRLVYAPGCDVGSITVDSEAMYIHLPEHEVGFTQREGEDEEAGKELPEAVRFVRALQSGGATAARPDLKLVGSSTVRLAAESGGDAAKASRPRRPAPLGGASAQVQQRDGTDEAGEDNDADDSDSGEEAESEASEAGEAEGGDSDGEHRQGVLERARKRFERTASLAEVVYGSTAPRPGRPADDGGPAPGGRAPAELKPTDHATVDLFDDGDDDGADADGRGANVQSSHKDLFGNFGDIDGMDTARMAVLPGDVESWEEAQREAVKTRKFITGGWSSAEEEEDEKKGSKAPGGDPAPPGDAGAAGAGAGDGTADAGSVVAADTFSDSVPIATFVRVRLSGVPAACVAEMCPDRPVVLGGLLPGESKMGMVQVRIKRHRWHPKLIKSGDALLLSVGWRRFQTLPTFSLEDRGEKRMRFIKYTLEHAHCTMTSYCPMVPPNTGVLAFRSWEKVGHFRVCGTGGVLESAPNFNIMKKLKLVGEPYKIFKNTAFVRNMFNSDLEVSKYMHAKIQTVSNVRGEIKKAESTRGNFRATFEDRILMSDLVVCKCWINVEPKQFYHPVLDVKGWRPVRLIGELRANAGVPVPNNKNSQYGAQIVRPDRKFNPLKVPSSLEQSLPFTSKRVSAPTKKMKPLRKKTAVVSSDHEKAINSLLTRLRTVRNEKARLRTAANAKKKATKETHDKFIQAKRDEVTAETRKKRYIKQGQQEQRRRKVMRLE